MMSIFTVLFVTLLAYYIWKKFGDNAGLFALALAVFCPQFLGFGHLVITDIAIAATGFLATMTFIKMIKDQTNKSAILWGLALALVALSKYIAIIFIAFFIIAYIYNILFSQKQARVRYLLIGLITTYICIVIVYAFGQK